VLALARCPAEAHLSFVGPACVVGIEDAVVDGFADDEVEHQQRRCEEQELDHKPEATVRAALSKAESIVVLIRHHEQVCEASHSTANGRGVADVQREFAYQLRSWSVTW
jgi:hypothetical protein